MVSPISITVPIRHFTLTISVYSFTAGKIDSLQASSKPAYIGQQWSDLIAAKLKIATAALLDPICMYYILLLSKLSVYKPPVSKLVMGNSCQF